jgi:hypothetical protein
VIVTESVSSGDLEFSQSVRIDRLVDIQPNSSSYIVLLFFSSSFPHTHSAKRSRCSAAALSFKGLRLPDTRYHAHAMSNSVNLEPKIHFALPN